MTITIHADPVPLRVCYLAVTRPREIPPWETEETEPLGAQHFEG